MDWAYRLVFHATRRMLFQTGFYVFDGEFDRKMKMVRQKIIVNGKGKLSCRTLLQSIHMSKDELQRILDTMLARGDIEMSHSPKGGLVYTIGRS